MEEIIYNKFIDKFGIEMIKYKPQLMSLLDYYKDLYKWLMYGTDEAAIQTDREDIKVRVNDLEVVVNNNYPDVRKMLNTIQASTIKNKLKLDDSLLVSTSYLSAILDELKKDKPKFNIIRQIIADSNIDDFEEVFRFLYDKADEYLPGTSGTVAILINDHQYKANFRIDKEINIMSLINNIINNK